MLKQSVARLGTSLVLGLGLTLAVLGLAASRLPIASATGPWFVSTTGSDSNDCSSAGTACLTIGGAVLKASSGDLINIAAGTYFENVSITGKALTFAGAGAPFTIVDGGGTDRVFDSDSDLTLSDLTIQNGNATSSDGGGLHTTGAVTLVNVNIFSSTAFFNGGGVFATGPALFSGSLFQGNTGIHGGGAYISNTLTLVGTQFLSNTASVWGGGARALLPIDATGGLFQNDNAVSGGGLYAGATLTLADTQFLSNSATSFGGGAYFNSAANVAGAAFSNNTANDGGGAHFDGPVTLIGTTFLSNTANNVGGGAYFNAVATLTDTNFTQNLGNSSAAGGGGATFVYTATLSGGKFLSNTTHFAGGGAYFGMPVAITGTKFTSNTATINRGGGAYFNGPADLSGVTFLLNVAVNDRGAGAYFRSTASITGTSFSANVTPIRGGGAYFFAPAALTYTAFYLNSAGVHGGGAYFGDAFTMFDVLFVSNTAQTGNGGGLFQAGAGSGYLANGLFSRNRAGVAGSDLFLGTSATTVVLNTTLANSPANPGAAIFVNAGSLGITNTLFANYAASLVITGGVTVNSDYNLFFNAPTSVITGSHSLTGTDPLLLDTANLDFHLGPGSPAAGAGVDAGISTDLLGTPRGNPPSIGVYELPTFSLSVASAGTGLGSVTRVPSATVYAQGTVVTLTASPDPGSNFAGWSGDVSGPTNPISIIVDSDKSVTATFNLNPPDADLKIGVRGTPGPAAPGQLLTYTLAVTNTGPGPASAVRLTDTLSVSSTFQSLASPGGWSCASPGVGSTGHIVCTTGSLSVSAPAVFTITVQLANAAALPPSALVTNTAIVTSATHDPTVPNVAAATTRIFALRFYWPVQAR